MTAIYGCSTREKLEELIRRENTAAEAALVVYFSHAYGRSHR